MQENIVIALFLSFDQVCSATLALILGLIYHITLILLTRIIMIKIKIS